MRTVTAIVAVMLPLAAVAQEQPITAQRPKFCDRNSSLTPP